MGWKISGVWNWFRSCPVADFGNTDVGPSGSATPVFCSELFNFTNPVYQYD